MHRAHNAVACVATTLILSGSLPLQAHQVPAPTPQSQAIPNEPSYDECVRLYRRGETELAITRLTSLLGDALGASQTPPRDISEWTSDMRQQDESWSARSIPAAPVRRVLPQRRDVCRAGRRVYPAPPDQASSSRRLLPRTATSSRSRRGRRSCAAGICCGRRHGRDTAGCLLPTSRTTWSSDSRSTRTTPSWRCPRVRATS